MAEYTDYQLPLTDAEIKNALNIVHNMQRGTVTINASGNNAIETVTVYLGTNHITPKVFLQLNAKTNTISPSWGIVPVVSEVTDTQFNVSLVAPGSKESDIRKVAAGTYYIDYMVIG